MRALATICGMNRHTGKWLTGVDHLRQSIIDILTTPIGSRICNRDYGSRLIDLIDAPLNDAGRQALFAATATAIALWFPQFVLTAIGIESTEPGAVTIAIYGHERGAVNDNAPLTLEIPLSPIAA